MSSEIDYLQIPMRINATKCQPTGVKQSTRNPAFGLHEYRRHTASWNMKTVRSYFTMDCAGQSQGTTVPLPADISSEGIWFETKREVWIWSIPQRDGNSVVTCSTDRRYYVNLQWTRLVEIRNYVLLFCEKDSNRLTLLGAVNGNTRWLYGFFIGTHTWVIAAHRCIEPLSGLVNQCSEDSAIKLVVFCILIAAMAILPSNWFRLRNKLV